MKEGMVTICIGTIGSPTFKRCKETIYKNFSEHPKVDKIVIIRNKRPQSAWLNAMKEACKDTEWCLQVDEDMYLYPEALDELLKFANSEKKRGVKILNASSLLYDLFLKNKIGSLKLWNTESLQKMNFKNVLGGDRDIAKRARKDGYRNVQISKVLGDHDSAPTPAIAYAKYYEYVQKIRKFESEKAAARFSERLKKKWKREKTYISKKAYDGSKAGLRGRLVNRSKSAPKSNKAVLELEDISGVKEVSSKKSLICCIDEDSPKSIVGQIFSRKNLGTYQEINVSTYKSHPDFKKIRAKSILYKNVNLFINNESDKKNEVLNSLYLECLYPNIFTIENRLAKKYELKNNFAKIVPNKKIKIGILTASWKRQKVTKKYCENMKYLVEQFKSEADVIPVIVDSDGHNHAHAKENGVIYLRHKNQPLSDKFNFGMQYFANKDVNAVLILGSDNFICSDLFKLYIKILRNNYELAGALDSHIYDNLTNKFFYFRGYTNHRMGETLGAGRMLSGSLLSKLKFTPWDYGLKRNLDGSMWKKLNKLEFNEYKILTKKNNYLLLGVKTDLFLTDIKNFRTKTPADIKMIKKIPCLSKVKLRRNIFV